MSARPASSVRRGSATINVARFSCARFSAAPNTGCDSVVFAPAMKIDRKSTRLNSSHGSISYAVFCLKKKKKKKTKSTEKTINYETENYDISLLNPDTNK